MWHPPINYHCLNGGPEKTSTSHSLGGGQDSLVGSIIGGAYPLSLTNRLRIVWESRGWVFGSSMNLWTCPTCINSLILSFPATYFLYCDRNSGKGKCLLVFALCDVGTFRGVGMRLVFKASSNILPYWHSTRCIG